MPDNKIIIVTGGAGYIGSHTVRLLSNSGYLPVVIDNLSTGHRDVIKWGIFEEGSVSDIDFMGLIFRKYPPLGVIHFAASSEVEESQRDPIKYYKNNVEATLALLLAMKEYNINKFVFSSTSAIYGHPNIRIIPENTPKNPINVYGKTKYMVEMILEDFAAVYNLNYVALRYFNACGADPSCEIGELHDPETHLIPRALMAAAGKIEGLNLYGDDYPTEDGSCIRDYIHVNDLARAHIKCLEYLGLGGESAAFNLGTGKGTSVKGIISAVENVTGKKIPVIIKPRRIGDPPSLVSDSSLIKEKLGFETEWNLIEESVLTAWNFHRKKWNL
jgi:UDP-arabinose 4-epimerase